MKSGRNFPFKSIVFCVCVLAGMYAGRAVWLPLVARPLILDEAPFKADVAVVLAGDARGHRVLKAAELATAGYVGKVMVSGPAGIYGHNEDDLAIPFAVRHGYSPELFIPISHTATSTAEESVVIVRELQRRKIGSYILVTSDYHTARAARIFRATARKLGGNLEMRVVASPDEDFRVGDWWHNRQAKKTVLMEWSKTFATALGI